MLTEKLMNEGLFTTERTEESKQRHIARRLIDEAVRNLILAMRSAELDEAYSRDVIERFVMLRMEAHEKEIYSLEEDEFSAYLEACLFKQFVRRIRDEEQ